MKTRGQRRREGAKRTKSERSIRRDAQESAAVLVLKAADSYEAAAVALSQAVMGVVDRNEYKANVRVNIALEELRKAVRTWRNLRNG